MNLSQDSNYDHHPRSLPLTELVFNQAVDPSDPSYASVAKSRIWHSLWRFSQIPNFKNLYNYETEEFAGTSLHSRCAEITATMGPSNDIAFASLKVLPSGDVLIRFKDFISWFIFDKDLPHFLSFPYQDPFTQRDQIAEVPVGYFNRPIQIMRVDVNHPSLSLRPRDIADFIVRELKFTKGNYAVRYRLLDGVWTGQFCIYFNTQREFSQLFPNKAVNFSPPDAPPRVAQVEEYLYLPPPPKRSAQVPSMVAKAPPARAPPNAVTANVPLPARTPRVTLSNTRFSIATARTGTPPAVKRAPLLPNPTPIPTHVVTSVDLGAVSLCATKGKGPIPAQPSPAQPRAQRQVTKKVSPPKSASTNAAPPPPLSEAQEDEVLLTAMDIAASNEDWSLGSRRPLPFLRRSIRATGGKHAKSRVPPLATPAAKPSTKRTWAHAQAKLIRTGSSNVNSNSNDPVRFTFDLTNDPPPSSSSPMEVASFLDGILADAAHMDDPPSQVPTHLSTLTVTPSTASPPLSPPRASTAAHPHSNVGVIASLFGSVVPRTRRRG